MIKEAYVSFETAKLLKEKGFDESCYQKYDSDGELSFNHVGYINSEKSCDDFYALAPTHQMALAWLREVHNINIDIVPVWNQIRWEYQIFIITPTTSQHPYVDDTLYLNYEEAIDAALKYVLENLI